MDLTYILPRSHFISCYWTLHCIEVFLSYERMIHVHSCDRIIRRWFTMAADNYTVCRTALPLSSCLGLAPFSLAGNVGSRCLRTSAFGIPYNITFPVVLSVLTLCWSEIWHIKLTICDVSAGAIYFIIIFHLMI